MAEDGDGDDGHGATATGRRERSAGKARGDVGGALVGSRGEEEE